MFVSYIVVAGLLLAGLFADVSNIRLSSERPGNTDRNANRHTAKNLIFSIKPLNKLYTPHKYFVSKIVNGFKPLKKSTLKM